jgi:hypothetical protein
MHQVPERPDVGRCHADEFGTDMENTCCANNLLTADHLHGVGKLTPRDGDVQRGNGPHRQPATRFQEASSGTAVEDSHSHLGGDGHQVRPCATGRIESVTHWARPSPLAAGCSSPHPDFVSHCAADHDWPACDDAHVSSSVEVVDEFNGEQLAGACRFIADRHEFAVVHSLHERIAHDPQYTM